MEINNYSEYIKDDQLNEIMKLFSEDMRNSNVDIYIFKNDNGFQGITMSENLKYKVNNFLQSKNSIAIYMYPEDVIFVVEERLLSVCNTWDEFYINVPFILSHELGHFKQAYFLEKRFNIMLSDYSLNYQEVFENNQFDKLHWCEKDAYTYSYRFIAKHKKKIMKLFKINDWLNLPSVDFNINYEKEWKKYKRRMMVSEQILWMVRDFVWERKVLD